MAPKVAIVYVSTTNHLVYTDLPAANCTPKYSLYGHIKKLAEAEKEGIESAGGKVDVYQYAVLTSDTFLHFPH